ncbi:polyprenyl synthetase family protein [Kutzneria viridogrisea]|uniref:Geranylgeranyl pyrophosphate synthase n=2 Tax=Kutzneria TaxID=43356 RepID=W5WPH9_9PSEU|nr:polyprenyl synthetase family protein [Kutzneria albida]AHI00090.1 hypothetical protein KALB_6731 [Kutzneria albida DSM 43870]MBA8925269.1 geranylgeranyl diphosphate synthase type I [Kutzneria viridogrisea]
MSKPGTLDAARAEVRPVAPQAASAPEPHPQDTALLDNVERALVDYLGGRRTEAARIEDSFGVAVDALATFVLGGGKRIRPTFAWWGWRGAGGDPSGPQTQAVVRAVSALELIQACALVHDDLMDASAVRRGSPTVHVAFAQRHRANDWAGAPERFGQAAAVLLGDLALAWADDMLRESGLSGAQLDRAAGPWRAMRTEMLAGQYLDVLTQARADSSPEAALRVDRLKTAAYTVERPLHLGAALAGAGPELVDGLRRFGVDIGLAFQLRDDLLGVFGDPEVTGKPAGDDLREGKRTLLVSLGLTRAEQGGQHARARALREAIGRADLDEPGVDAVRELLVELGAVDAVEARIGELTERALATLRATELAEPAESRLAALAVAATRRTH